jgi:uncharacterized protein YecT (DUF1311 family)
MLCVLVVAGCGAAKPASTLTSNGTRTGVPLKPPRLRTSPTAFSVGQFACPKNPVSTVEIESCLVRRKLALNASINRRVTVVFRLLKERRSARALRRFVQDERAWLSYRDASCRSPSDIYEGGTASGVVYGDCVVKLNAAHLRELKAFEGDLRH